MPIHRKKPRAIAAAIFVLVVTLPGLGAPVLGSTSAGAVPISEISVSPGWSIDTYGSATGTLRVFGRSGQSVTVATATADTIGAAVTSPDMKSWPTSNGSPTGAVAALIALGVDPLTALRDFGGMDSLDGSTPTADQNLATAVTVAESRSGRQFARVMKEDRSLSSRLPVGPSTNLPSGVSVSSTVPYDTQCITVSAVKNLIQGYGCSTLYLVWANGGDWFFANKYKFSAQSTSTALFPLRLKGVGWRLSFVSTGGNTLYDWDPSSTQTIGGCTIVTVSSQGDPAHGSVGISISSEICPNTLGPWGPINSYQSGAQWIGNESGNDFEVAIGTQELHNPATASSSHTSTYYVSYQCGTDC